MIFLVLFVALCACGASVFQSLTIGRLSARVQYLEAMEAARHRS